VSLENYLDKLWSGYIQLNPEAQKIHSLFQERGETVQNDHIAMRTFDRGPFSNSALLPVFEKFGYKVGGDYSFEQKKLNAVHLEPENPIHPKIFMSEMRVGEFSPFAQQTIDDILEEAKAVPASEIINRSRPWAADYKTYQALAEESEYASWLYAYGIQVNHFTVFFNALKTFKNLDELNQWLLSEGFVMNTSGGMIKGTPQDLLEQSSTMAPKIAVDFTEGSFEIPGCYYEFAKRHEDASGKLFQGFVTKSADKIFESTFQKS